MMLNMFSVFAEFERDLMLERQREGIAKAKAEQKYKGRKPTARAKAGEAVTLYRQQKTVSEIAMSLGIGRGSVYRGRWRLPASRMLPKRSDAPAAKMPCLDLFFRLAEGGSFTLHSCIHDATPRSALASQADEQGSTSADADLSMPLHERQLCAHGSHSYGAVNSPRADIANLKRCQASS